MATLSTSIKSLASLVDDSNVNEVVSKSKAAVIGTTDDKLKFICDNKEMLFKAIDLAKVFTGAKGDKLLDALRAVIEKLCA